MYFRSLLGAALVFAAGMGMAADGAVEKNLRAKLAKLLPDHAPTSIRPAAMPGLYEVAFGAQLVYISADGRYLFQGSVIDIDNKTDLTEAARSGARKAVLAKVDESSMIVFSPPKPKHTVTVFTDVDCGYCRKMHTEIEQYKAKGIKVRYMMFPRAGIDSPSYKTAVSVWCAEDRSAALTRAKKGQDVVAKTCKNPIGKQLALGVELGVQGTPAMILEDGELMMGYKNPTELAALLDEAAVSSKAATHASEASAAR